MTDPSARSPALVAVANAIEAAAVDDAPGVLGELARWQAIVLARYVGRAPAPRAVPIPDALLTVRDVATRLHVPPQHVYALIRTGDLPALRCGKKYLRIDPGDLARWHAAHHLAPPPSLRRLARRHT